MSIRCGGPSSFMRIDLRKFDTIGSTNTEALEAARAGAAEGHCIIARQQTAGRGRRGRTWVSEKDAGLYLSVVLRPKLDPRFLSLITLMTGVAVHDTLESLGMKPDLKWVNDVHINGRKICGILAETTETPQGTAVVVGIGINVRPGNYPPEVAEVATSIESEKGDAPAVDAVAEKLLAKVTEYYALLQSKDGPQAVIEEWSGRSSYFRGKRVRAESEGEVINGVTDGLEPNGALRIRRDDGSIAVIVAGDVSTLRPEESLN